MATMRGQRLQVGSGAWIADERNAAFDIAQSEVEEFSYSARNELDWLNEHMAGIFNENETNFAETFKTPGKLRGRTPRTIKKADALETRVPLSEVFSATPKGESSPATRIQSPRINEQLARGSPSMRPVPNRLAVFSPQAAMHATQTSHAAQDSGYFGSQDVAPVNIHMDTDSEFGEQSPQKAVSKTRIPLKNSPTRTAFMDSTERTFQTAQEDQTTRALATAATNIRAETQFEVAQEFTDEDEVSPERQLSLEAKQSAKYADDARSASDASSPIRHLVRKSSLNFASLPAREPLTAGKSMGARVSRTSHLEHIRTSYYNRPTGGKSLGGTLGKLDWEDDQGDKMTTDDDLTSRAGITEDTKTYTQRLQDQINKLGQSQAKTSQQTKTPAPRAASPMALNTLQSTPGAFPEDDDDDWIEPPATASVTHEERPSLPKSYSADVMEGIQGKTTIGHTDFASSDDEPEASKPLVQHGAKVAHSVYGHGKSSSATVLPNARLDTENIQALKLGVSVSNPSLLIGAESSIHDTPSKSPSVRSFRESPLKQVKNKLSSILKSSRGLLASSAAVSAEGKSLMSPSSTRLGLHSYKSSESLASQRRIDLQRLAAAQDASLTRPTRRTRASVEKEKEDKKREKEAKQVEEQHEKLEKARQKECEKARIFSKEREKIAAMEKQIASKREDDRLPQHERTGLRQDKTYEDQTAFQNKDIDMEDAMPPPSAPRSIGLQPTRNKEVKRTLKPMRETQSSRPKQAPTVIRVNTGSQHSQYRLSTAQNEPPAVSTSQMQPELTSKVSKASLQNKPSSQGLRGGPSAPARTKAQELAAKKKEQEEREAQKRRDAKAELDRKKMVAQEEQRKQEQLRRQEMERQKQQQQQASSQAQSKTNAQRKAAIEKAKQTRAPPPAARSQPNGPPDFAMGQDSQPPRPVSRMASNSQRNRDDSNRTVSTVLSNAPKQGTKRTFAPDKGDDPQATQSQSRTGPAYQTHDAKRRRTSDVANDEPDVSSQRNIKGPPVRPSAGFKKELQSKSVFQSGYANAPQSATRGGDLFKATVTAQHASQMKASHPLDMAQISKGAIPFAPNSNAAGPAHKTPARPGPVHGTKSATRSSPRFQNGETIELPEIETDEDSEDDEANGLSVAPWADSPDLRRALTMQETMDPSQIFGPPKPLNMEEVFNKSKDRWHKFRARTSSANWSGADRLTEDDIRKDLAARDKLRRDGGWSYEMSKDLV